MASIRKVKNKWEARVRVKGHSTYCKSFTQKSDALAWSKSVEVGLETGITPLTRMNKSLSFKDAVEKYLQEISPSKKSHQSEFYRLKKLLASSLAKLYLTDIKTSDVKLFRDKRLLEVSTGSVRKELYLVSSLFEIARREWGFETLSNPVRNLRLPKDSPPRTKRLSSEERQRLLYSLERQPNKTLERLAILALETAMRRSELCNLKWENINFDGCLLEIQNSKNGEARHIPLTPSAILALKNIPKENELVFGYTTNAVRQAWERFRNKYGFEYLRFHDLRHEAISQLFELGLSVPEVAAISGHRTVSQLFRYAHSDTLMLRQKIMKVLP